MTSKCKAENLPLELNFNLAYDHFKEQDQLRNSALTFFTAVTGLTQVIGTEKFSDAAMLKPLNLYIIISSALFVLGIILGIVSCRYKFYGEIYSITMRILRWLMVNSKLEVDNHFLESILNKCLEEKDTRFWVRIYSADKLLFLGLAVVNCINLCYVLQMCGILDLKIMIGISVLYIGLMICIFKCLVLIKVKKSKLNQYDFLCFFPQSDIFQDSVKKCDQGIPHSHTCPKIINKIEINK